MAPVIAARAKTGSSYVQGIPTANSILASMKDFDNLWRGNLFYNSDRWARIKTAENRFQRPSVMPRKPRILASNGRLPEPEIIIEDGKSLNFLSTRKNNWYNSDDEDEEDEEADQEFIRKARKSLAMSHPATLSANPENIPSEIAITAYESKETLNSEYSQPP